MSLNSTHWTFKYLKMLKCCTLSYSTLSYPIVSHLIVSSCILLLNILAYPILSSCTILYIVSRFLITVVYRTVTYSKTCLVEYLISSWLSLCELIEEMKLQRTTLTEVVDVCAWARPHGEDELQEVKKDDCGFQTAPGLCENPMSPCE